MSKVREFKEHNYKSVYFAGKTIRFSLDPTKDIEELTYPEFYDVKITDYCEGNCSYCYMDSTCKGKHHTDILGKIDSYFGKMSDNERPFQVAIGGGEPTTHPEFIECLAKFSDLGIST